VKTVKPTAEQQTFLDSVSDFNKRFNAVRTGPSLETLCHPFWSAAEIARSLNMRADWEIPNSLIPFYGDWHTVICLDPREGTVKLLHDDREIVFTWASISEFIQSLQNEPERPIDTSGIIESESWLDF